MNVTHVFKCSKCGLTQFTKVGELWLCNFCEDQRMKDDYERLIMLGVKATMLEDKRLLKALKGEVKKE